MRVRMRRRVVAGAGAALLPLLAACGSGSGAAQQPSPLRIGALFPLSGSVKADAADEYLGARIAADMVNGAGGVAGRQVQLDVRDLESRDPAPSLARSLPRAGAAAGI